MNKILLFLLLGVCCKTSDEYIVRTACVLDLDLAKNSPNVIAAIKANCRSNLFNIETVDWDRCIRADNTLGYTYKLRLLCK